MCVQLEAFQALRKLRVLGPYSNKDAAHKAILLMVLLSILWAQMRVGLDALGHMQDADTTAHPLWVQPF